MARHGSARHGGAWHGVARLGRARRGTAGHGRARHGLGGDKIEQKEIPLEQQVGAIRKDVAVLARKLRVKPQEALMLLQQREFVIMNRQLTQLHEMLDLLYGEKLKKKGG